jgi:hypothetical protein
MDTFGEFEGNEEKAMIAARLECMRKYTKKSQSDYVDICLVGRNAV